MDFENKKWQCVYLFYQKSYYNIRNAPFFLDNVCNIFDALFSKSNDKFTCACGVFGSQEMNEADKLFKKKLPPEKVAIKLPKPFANYFFFK